MLGGYMENFISKKEYEEKLNNAIEKLKKGKINALVFSERLALEDSFFKYINKSGVEARPSTVIGFLQILINGDKSSKL